MIVDPEALRQRLHNFDFAGIFTQELGWDFPGQNLSATIDSTQITLNAVAEKRGLAVFSCEAPGDYHADEFDYATRRKIERRVAELAREHILIFVDQNRIKQTWQWVKREPGKPDACREQTWFTGHSGERILQKLQELFVSLEEEEDLTLVDVSGRVRAAFDVQRATKRFFDNFRTEHDKYLGFIEGIGDISDKEWYASLMLNRLMFIYFIQKKGFLDGDLNYLRNRLATVRDQREDSFYDFYRYFLLRLFHEGLAQQIGERAEDLEDLLGVVPFLNGGLFEVHDLEQMYEIQIADQAFERIFDFFDAYDWHLDERPLKDDREINPDVLGYIFERYVNQKQMGAYYTKEDVTGYMTEYTLIPRIIDSLQELSRDRFYETATLLLASTPARYLKQSLKTGVDAELPKHISEGIEDIAKRSGWDSMADPQFGLPSETWREHVERRNRYNRAIEALKHVTNLSTPQIVENNLDAIQLMQDTIQETDNPDLIRDIYVLLAGGVASNGDVKTPITILDPTCGSGAFLFSVLNSLETLYEACLARMESFRSEEVDPDNLFSETLSKVHSHANERYFILKTIIVENLFGVDIMDEAVEICKLRLFLKLVAQLETYDQIEPLPDIDFNIRAGNTLVGFVSMDMLRDSLAGDLLKEQALPDIEQRASIANQSFNDFHAAQITDVPDSAAMYQAKETLRDALKSLRSELDVTLAESQGINVEDQDEFAAWRLKHKPFHWLAEFFGIIERGGFDLIIGNPPYITYPNKKIPYTLDNDSFSTLAAKNLYVFVFERSIELAHGHSPIGFVVPLTVLSSERVAVIQEALLARGTFAAVSFPRRPQSVFEGVEMPVSIILSFGDGQTGNILSSDVCRFYANERSTVFPRLSLVNHDVVIHGHRIAKFGSQVEKDIFAKLAQSDTEVQSFAEKNSEHSVYYQEACRYWVKASHIRPYFVRNGVEMEPPHGRKITVESESAAAFLSVLMNSSIFYWYYSAFSDCEHINDKLVRSFPIPNSWNDADVDWLDIANRLSKSLSDNATRKEITTQEGHEIEYDEIDASKSTANIGEVDDVLCELYGLSDVEHDYLKSYDLKYRIDLLNKPDLI